MAPEALASVADYFKVLSETSRLLILCELRSGPMSVTELVAATGMGQANVSRHLKVLSQAGILTRLPQGVSVYYHISDPICLELCEVVCKQLIERWQQKSQQLQQGPR